MVWAKRKRKGLTLIETLVASVIFCGAVLTVGAISTSSLVATGFNRRCEVALSIIDKQLSLIDYIGIDEFIQIGQMEGDFQEIEPGYHWQVVTEYMDIDSLYLVKITVSWMERNHPYNVSVDTMLDGITLYIDVSEEQE